MRKWINNGLLLLKSKTCWLAVEPRNSFGSFIKVIGVSKTSTQEKMRQKILDSLTFKCAKRTTSSLRQAY